MDKQIKRKWIEALRSGEYAQGRGVLVKAGKDYDKFCCLGVLCDVMGCEWEERDGNLMTQDGAVSLLPRSLRLRTGISWGEQTFLARLNDKEKQPSFKCIADWIEKNL